MVLKVLLKEINIEILIAAVGLILTLLGLIWTIILRTALERKKNAIDMMKEWNKFTSQQTNLIRDHYPDNYNNCKPISKIEIEKILNKIDLKEDENDKYRKIKTAIHRLLNYFEYVSAAYNKNAVNKRIIRNSFSAVMLRFYIMLKYFLIRELLDSGRNHWKPFTLHLKKVIRKKSYLLCPLCKDRNCLLSSKEEAIDVKVLKYMNSEHTDIFKIKKLFKYRKLRKSATMDSNPLKNEIELFYNQI